MNLNNNNKISKSIEIKENKIKHNYILHPKPDKPINYLKDLIKLKKNKKNINKSDVGVGVILAELNQGENNDTNHIIEKLDMVKSLNNRIDRKILEKKEFLKVKGGYLHNTKLGDEVGNLIIESIQNKLSLLNTLNGQ